MARPLKTGLDYFPLDVNFDDEFKALEELHGNNGFTWMVKFWQAAYKTSDGIVDLSGIRGIIAAKTSRISTDKQNEIIKDCLDLQLLKRIDDYKYTSDGIQKRMHRVLKDRESDRNYTKNELSEGKPTDNIAIRGESKEKESKGNKRKEKKIFIAPTIEDVKAYFKENGYNETLATNFFRAYSVNDWKDSNDKQISNWKQKAQMVWFKDEGKLATGSKCGWRPPANV